MKVAVNAFDALAMSKKRPFHVQLLDRHPAPQEQEQEQDEPPSEESATKRRRTDPRNIVPVLGTRIEDMLHMALEEHNPRECDNCSQACAERTNGAKEASSLITGEALTYAELGALRLDIFTQSSNVTASPVRRGQRNPSGRRRSSITEQLCQSKKIKRVAWTPCAWKKCPTMPAAIAARVAAACIEENRITWAPGVIAKAHKEPMIVLSATSTPLPTPPSGKSSGSTAKAPREAVIISVGWNLPHMRSSDLYPLRSFHRAEFETLASRGSIIDACCPRQPVPRTTVMCDLCRKPSIYAECHVVWSPRQHGWGKLPVSKVVLDVIASHKGKQVCASFPLAMACEPSLAADEAQSAVGPFPFSSAADLVVLDDKMGHATSQLPRVHRVLCFSCWSCPTSAAEVLEQTTQLLDKISVDPLVPSIDMSDMLRECCARFLAIDYAYNLSLTGYEAVVMAADFARLRHCCVDLLSASFSGDPASSDLRKVHFEAIKALVEIDMNASFTWHQSCRPFESLREFFRSLLDVYTVVLDSESNEGSALPRFSQMQRSDSQSERIVADTLKLRLSTLCTPEKHSVAAMRLARSDPDAKALITAYDNHHQQQQ
ncbi:hypothetical protein [Mollivirus kamchatka]|nr:hypothetical protein [Mollivirus kamchatka]